MAALGKAVPKGKMDVESAEPEGAAESSESSEQEYGDVLADVLGVEEADRSSFLDALRGYVKACASSEK